MAFNAAIKKQSRVHRTHFKWNAFVFYPTIWYWRSLDKPKAANLGNGRARRRGHPASWFGPFTGRRCGGHSYEGPPTG